MAALLGMCLAAGGAPPQPQVTAPPAIATGVLSTAEAYLRRGDQYAAAQDYDRAISDYTQAIKLNPDYAEAYNNRGYAEYWNGKVEVTNVRPTGTS